MPYRHDKLADTCPVLSYYDLNRQVLVFQVLGKDDIRVKQFPQGRIVVEIACSERSFENMMDCFSGVLKHILGDVEGRRELLHEINKRILESEKVRVVTHKPLRKRKRGVKNVSEEATKK